MKFCLTHEGITRSRLPAFTRVYTDKTSICIIRRFDPVIQASFTLASTWVNFTRFWSLSIAIEYHWMWVGSLHNTVPWSHLISSLPGFNSFVLIFVKEPLSWLIEWRLWLANQWHAHVYITFWDRLGSLRTLGVKVLKSTWYQILSPNEKP